MRISTTASRYALATFLTLCGLGAVRVDAAETLKPDMEKCKITFIGGKPDGTTHEGGFKKFKIDAKADFEDSANSSLRIEIDTESLFADDPKLEGHLKNPDFFDVKNYPKAVFESTKIEMGEEGGVVVGKLKMLNKTEEVKLPIKIEHTDALTKLTGKLKIDRTKWGMNYGVEGNKINKEVEVAFALEFKN